MRIAYDNILNYAASITATNEKANRPISNALHPYLEKVFEAENGSPLQSVVTATFNDPQIANCFVYGNHNILLGGLNFKDAFDNFIVIIPLPSTDIFAGNRLFEFPEVEGIYKIEITLVTLDSSLHAGSLFISKYLEMPRFNQGPDFSISLRSTSFESGSGQSSGNASVNLDNFPFSWTDIDYAKLNEIKEYLEFVQTSKPHWIDPYPELQEGNPQPDEKSEKFPIQYVKLSQADIPTPKRRIRDWKYNINLTYREAK